MTAIDDLRAAEQAARDAVEREAEQSHVTGWRQRHFNALDAYRDAILAPFPCCDMRVEYDEKHDGGRRIWDCGTCIFCKARAAQTSREAT